MLFTYELLSQSGTNCGVYSRTEFLDPAEQVRNGACASGFSWAKFRYLAGTASCGSLTRTSNVSLSCGE